MQGLCDDETVQEGRKELYIYDEYILAVRVERRAYFFVV